MRTSITSRLFFILITAWMSICLFLIGFMPVMENMLRQTWLLTGAIGLVACIGLTHLLFIEAKQNANLLREFEVKSLTDPLTNLPNRRGFDLHLNELLARANSSFRPEDERTIFLALLDVDHFKNVNDDNGHPIGDRMLEFVAQSIYAYVPEKSVAARLGGDEFGIVYLDADPELVVWSLKTIRSTIDEESSQRDDLIHTTVSIGLTNQLPMDTYESIFERADRALYKTKDAGRNRITFT